VNLFLCIMKEIADVCGRDLPVEDVEPRVDRKKSNKPNMRISGRNTYNLK